MKLFEDIQEQITRYEEVYKTASIDTLLNAADWFAIQACRLGEVVADLKDDYNANYYIRKLSIAKNIQGLMNESKFSKAKAENESIVECADKFEDELRSEGVAIRAEILLRQINVLVKTIQQRISHLKKEKENTSNYNG